MWMRILAAVVLLPLLVVMLFWLPTLVTTLVCSLALAIAAYELLWGTGLVKHVRLTVYTALMAALMPLWCHFGMGYLPALIVVFLFTAVLFAEVLISKLAIRFDQITVCLAGGLLIGLFEAFASLALNVTYAQAIIYLLFLVILLVLPKGLMGRE